MSYKTNTSAVNGLVDLKLVNYTTTADLNTALSAKADVSALADYVTSTALTTTLAGYVTDGELSTAIADFVTAGDLTGYVTTGALETALDDYTVTADLGSAAFLNTGTSAGNVVVLDGAGKINSALLPAMDIVDVHVVPNIAARDALTGMSNGDMAIVEDISTTYVWDGTVWVELKTPAGSFSGDYNDLTNKPTLGTAAAEDIEFFATAAQGAKADTAVQPAALTTALADYVLTVDFNDALALKANAADVYATTETYTKTEVDALIDAVEAGDVDTSLQAVAILTGSATLTSANQMAIVNKGAAVATITLDAAPATGKTVTIKDGSGNAAAFNVTIDGNGKNIDGAATLVINIDYEAVTLVYNGTQWNIV